MDQWASVVAASWLQGWDDCSLCVSQMRRLSLVVLKWGINVAEVMTMMSTHHFFSLGRWCVLSWSAMSSATKRDRSWPRDSPAVLYLETLWDRAIRPEFCVWWREVTARKTRKTLRKAPTTRTTRRRLRTTHRTTRTTPKTDRTTTRIILTTPRRKRTAPRTTRTTRWTT